MVLNNLQDWQWYGIINSGQSFQNFFKSKVPVTWTLQDATGDVATATNPAIPLGRELVINGGFDTDSDWAKGTGWTIAAGVASCDGSQVGNTNLDQSIVGLDVGGTYEVSYTVSNYSAGTIRALLGGSNPLTTNSANGTYTESTNSVEGELNIFIQGNADFIGDIDNVSVKQTDILADTSYPGAEEVTNGTFDTNINGWNNEAGFLYNTLEWQVGTIHAVEDGSNRAIFTSDENISLIAGKRYELSLDYTLNSGNNVNVLIKNTFGGGVTELQQLLSGSDSYSWIFTASATDDVIIQIDTVSAQATDFNMDNISIKEQNPFDADVTGAGIVSGFNGNLARNFDGATDFINNYSAEHNSYFNPSAGTLIALAKVRAASVWADGNVRYIQILGASGTNLIRIFKSNVNNTIVCRYIAGGTAEDISTTVLGGVTDWFMVALTWKKPGNFTLYVNGVPVGTPQAIGGTWVGNLDSTTTVIGASNITPSAVWDGDLSYVGLSNVAMTATEIANIYNRSGI
jgi:hypothetical protein